MAITAKEKFLWSIANRYIDNRMINLRNHIYVSIFPEAMSFVFIMQSLSIRKFSPSSQIPLSAILHFENNLFMKGRFSLQSAACTCSLTSACCSFFSSSVSSCVWLRTAEPLGLVEPPSCDVVPEAELPTVKV